MELPKPRSYRARENAADFPEVPKIEVSRRALAGEVNGIVLFNARGGLRVIERGRAPTYCVPFSEARMELLVDSGRRYSCPHRGVLAYWSLESGDARIREIAWTCVQPTPDFRQLQDHVGFFPGALDAAWLDGERVSPDPGDRFGGWVTSHIQGPFSSDLRSADAQEPSKETPHNPSI